MFDEQMPAERRAYRTNSAGRGVSNDAVLRNIHVLKTRDKISDVNKDWTCKDKDLNLVLKDKDKDFTYSYLLQVAAKPTIAIKRQQ